MLVSQTDESAWHDDQLHAERAREFERHGPCRVVEDQFARLQEDPAVVLLDHSGSADHQHDDQEAVVPCDRWLRPPQAHRTPFYGGDLQVAQPERPDGSRVLLARRCDVNRPERAVQSTAPVTRRRIGRLAGDLDFVHRTSGRNVHGFFHLERPRAAAWYSRGEVP